MTKSELAVTIAQDVLKSIPAYFGIIEHETFVRIGDDDLEYGKMAAITETKDSKLIAQKIKKYCEVCALGACFLSVVALTNKYDFGLSDNIDLSGEDVFKRLKSVFSLKQLYLIENAFELGQGFSAQRSRWHTDYLAAISFGKKYDRPKSRLRAIMKNIIANEGVFIP